MAVSVLHALVQPAIPVPGPMGDNGVHETFRRKDRYLFKGTLSRGFLLFEITNMLKFKLNAFSRTQNTHRTSREGNQMIFSKELNQPQSVSGDFLRNKEKT